MSTARPKEMKRTSEDREEQTLPIVDELTQWIRHQIREEPEVAACVCLGIGFILGWKLKPW